MGKGKLLFKGPPSPKTEKLVSKPAPKKNTLHKI